MARQHGKYLPYQFLPEIDLEMHAASPSGTNARHITQEFEERIRTEGATPPVRSKKEAIETVVVLGCAGSRNNESGGPRRCISRPHPMKTRRYHASPHRPTFARISNSYAVCRRLPTHHHFKIPTNSPVGIFLPTAACSRGLAWVPADFAEGPGGGIRPRFLSPLASSLRFCAL